jgi:hypothetical protein
MNRLAASMFQFRCHAAQWKSAKDMVIVFGPAGREGYYPGHIQEDAPH